MLTLTGIAWLIRSQQCKPQMLAVSDDPFTCELMLMVNKATKMRQAFTWGRHTTVRIYAEYGVDFYFREDDGIYGGLLISKNTIMGKDQQRHSKYSYSIHT